MNLNGSRVCVTGAGGFLGSHLCRSLLERGANVIALDDFSIGNRLALDDLSGEIAIVQADIRDPESIRKPIAEAEAVYHLAAIANPRTCQRDFPLAFDVNVCGTNNVLEASVHVQRFILLSSIMVYGESRYLPIDVQHSLDGRDPYAASKIISEELVKIANFIHKTPYSIVRNSNSYGPFQSEDYLIPTLITQALRHGTMEIWDPKAIRDFLYVSDTVEALICVLESEATDGEIVNLGSGRGVSVGEMANMISESLGVPWVDVNKPTPVAGKLIADVGKIEALTGWHQQVTHQEGINKTVEYFRKLMVDSS